MADLIVDVPYAFAVTAMKQRSRSWREMVATDVITVAIPEIKNAEIVANWKGYDGERRSVHDGNTFLNQVTVPGHWGFHFPHTDNPLTVDDFRRILDGSAPAMSLSKWIDLPSIPYDAETVRGTSIKEMTESKSEAKAFPSAGAFHPSLRMRSDFAQILRTDQAEAQRKAVQAVSRLAVIDGEVFARGNEPTVTYYLRESRSFQPSIDVSGDRHSFGWQLPLTAMDLYADIVEETKLELHRPDLIAFDPVVGNMTKLGWNIVPDAYPKSNDFYWRSANGLDRSIGQLDVAARAFEAADSNDRSAAEIVLRDAQHLPLRDEARLGIEAFAEAMEKHYSVSRDMEGPRP